MEKLQNNLLSSTTTTTNTREKRDKRTYTLRGLGVKSTYGPFLEPDSDKLNV